MVIEAIYLNKHSNILEMKNTAIKYTGTWTDECIDQLEGLFGL